MAPTKWRLKLETEPLKLADTKGDMAYVLRPACYVICREFLEDNFEDLPIDTGTISLEIANYCHSKQAVHVRITRTAFGRLVWRYPDSTLFPSNSATYPKLQRIFEQLPNVRDLPLSHVGDGLIDKPTADVWLSVNILSED